MSRRTETAYKAESPGKSAQQVKALLDLPLRRKQYIAEDHLFKSDDLSYRVNVMDLLPKEVGDYFRKGILHGYIETLRWTQDGLIIRTFGDRENTPRFFDVTLKCRMDNGRWTCKKMVDK